MAAMAEIPVSVAKSKFLDYFRQASKGMEIVAKNQTSKENVSLVSTPVVSAMLEAMQFSLEETIDAGLDNVITIAVNELPVYGEGKTREAAIEDLLETVIEYVDIYLNQIDLFSRIDTPKKQAYMLKLIRCGKDKSDLRKALGL